MLDGSPSSPPRLLRTEAAARWLGLSARTLEKHRCTGGGPTYRKLGGRVVYLVEDLEAWVAASVRRSTAYAGPVTARGRTRLSEARGFGR